MTDRAHIHFDDVEVGQSIGELIRGPLTTAHLMRWSAAMENWHKIHYDRAFAVKHDKLPDLLVNGSLKQNFIMTLLKDWAGPEAWVWKVSFQFRAMNLVGETLRVWAKVRDKHEGPDFGIVDLELGILNDEGKESTPGRARIALPYANGQPVPFPFVAPDL